MAGITDRQGVGALQEHSGPRMVWWAPTCILFVLTAIHFSFPLIVTFDSAHYHTYLPILSGKASWENWDIVRGPGFPIWLWVTHAVFGRGSQAAIAMAFTSYVALIASAAWLCWHVTSSRRGLLVAGTVVALLIVADPTVIGYFHTLLTEYLGATTTLLGLCLAVMFYDRLVGRAALRRFVPFALGFALLAILAYQIKQPYGLAIVFLIVSAIVAGSVVLNPRSVAAAGGLVLGGTVVALVLSIFLWHGFLPDSGPAARDDRSTSGFVTNQLLRNILNPGPTVSEVERDPDLRERLPESIRAEVLELSGASQPTKSCSRIWSDGESVGPNDMAVLVRCGGKSPTKAETAMALARTVFGHPLRAMRAYWALWRALLNSVEGRRRFSQHVVIAHRMFDVPKISNMFWVPSHLRPYIGEYRQPNFQPGVIMTTLGELRMFSRLAFVVLPSFALVLFPVLLVLLRLLSRRVSESVAAQYLGPMILAIFAALLYHAMSVIAGFTLDRYALPVYPLFAVGFAFGCALAADRVGRREIVACTETLVLSTRKVGHELVHARFRDNRKKSRRDERPAA